MAHSCDNTSEWSDLGPHAENRAASENWSEVDAPLAAAWTRNADLTELVMSFCDPSSLLILRRVCRRFASEEALPWTWILERLRHGRHSSFFARLTARDAKLPTPPIAQLSGIVRDVVSCEEDRREYVIVEDSWYLQQQLDCSAQFVRVIESERYTPGTGFCKRALWSHDPPPFEVIYTTNTPSCMASSLEAVVCPPGFAFGGEWGLAVCPLPASGVVSNGTVTVRAVESTESTDAFGWRYATSYGAADFTSSHKHFVRHREWRRKLTPVTDEARDDTAHPHHLVTSPQSISASKSETERASP